MCETVGVHRIADYVYWTLVSSGGLHPTRHDVKRIPGKGLGVALVTKRSRMGVRISQLNPDGPLAKAGLKEGDVIVQVHVELCIRVVGIGVRLYVLCLVVAEFRLGSLRVYTFWKSCHSTLLKVHLG